MTRPLPEPFFLLDESLSSGIVAEVSRVTGYPIATVWDEWPERDFDVNRLLDEEIILHLGNMAGHRAVWITGDRKAFSEHGHQIHAHGISVLWLRGPGRRPLGPEEQLQMLCAVMDKVRSLVFESNYPVYLRARLDADNDYQPFLQRLRDSVLDKPPCWQHVPLA